jgi:beta-mannosidase
MKGCRFIVLLSSICFLVISCQQNSTLKIEINKNWLFHQAETDEWLSAKVPGCVHTDLLSNSKIGDPYFGDNEQKLQWIEKKNWEYKTTIIIDKTVLDNDKVDLVFEGLDTYAQVFLNQTKILTADNMFREWVVDCKDNLNEGANELSVQFTSPVYMDSLKASKLPYKLPDQRGFTRKAPYQYGWDWGPRFVTSGVWKPVYIRAWNEILISDVHVSTVDIKDSEATITIEAEIEATEKRSARVSLQVNKIQFTERIELQKGINLFKTNLSVPDPKLWWPNGMGGQSLYQLNFNVESANSLDSQNISFGIRQIELVQQKDSTGESFYFKINGKPFFTKGANYIPQDNFPSRVTHEKYKKTIQSAVDANMNMLRVWGGGIYENDEFYNFCDEKGILVWQDFMFACNMYPGDKAFMENVRQEATQNVKRLRNHPCLALWCGNNEIDEGWLNWGWQKSLGYSDSDSTEIWNNYLKIFEEILPQTVLTYSPYTPYIPSSPRIGWGHEEALAEGDMHYWGVWWGEEPFEIYEEKVGRFISEYGFQGFPDLRTLDSYLSQSEMNLQSSALKNHQKHPRGMELIQTYMERDYKVPDNFENYAYVSQLVQAYGIKKAIEAHRRAMPRCMGTLYWQLNDCWPVISWSSVDYYNRWKALHYFVREAYKEMLISFEENNGQVEVYIISDLQKDTPATLNLQVIDFSGTVKWQTEKQVSISGTSSKIYSKVDVKKFSKSDHLLVASLIASDSIVAENLCYFLPPLELNLPQVKITKSIEPANNGYLIKLTADNLAKNVFLSIDQDGFFSDNYFDLLPGETRNIYFISSSYQKEFEEDLKVVLLQNIYK